MQQEEPTAATATSSVAPASSLASDAAFQQGLQSILAPYYARNASAEEIAEVTARAEAFYLQSTEPPPPPPPAAIPAPTGDAPPYPLSFASLAALIASGAPIPGIKDIPDKLAEGEPSESRVEVGSVRKPWERAPAPSSEMEEAREKAAEEGSGQV